MLGLFTQRVGGSTDSASPRQSTLFSLARAAHRVDFIRRTLPCSGTPPHLVLGASPWRWQTGCVCDASERNHIPAFPTRAWPPPPPEEPTQPDCPDAASRIRQRSRAQAGAQFSIFSPWRWGKRQAAAGQARKEQSHGWRMGWVFSLRSRRRSAGFQACCIAGFKTCRVSAWHWRSGIEVVVWFARNRIRCCIAGFAPWARDSRTTHDSIAAPPPRWTR